MRRRAGRYLRIIAAFSTVITLLLPTGAARAEATPTQKEEVVYGMLGLDGSVKSLYVVNILKGGEVTDYGNYSEIRNMTSTETLHLDGDRITVNTAAAKLYYQGKLISQNLPWSITIRYFLDGEELTGPELAGKSGELRIAVSITQNQAVDPSFYEGFALQLSITLDTLLCDNIVADGATIAEAGRNKQLSFTVLPGEGAKLQVTASVHDFEMEPISINGIRLNLGISFDETVFTNQISQLIAAIEGVDDGAGELLDGVRQLSEGMASYVEGLKEFKDGIVQLDSGVDGLKEGAQALDKGLLELSKQNTELIAGASAIRQTFFDTVNAQISAMELGLPVLTPKNYSLILSGIPELATVKNQLDNIVKFTEGLIGYTEAVSQLGEGASALSKGATELKSGSAVLATSAKELYDAAVTLNTAVGEVRDGLAAYKEGTKMIRDGTSGLNSEVENQINGILDSISGNGSKLVSFVSEKNTEVMAVQFVMKTEAIRLLKVETLAPKPKKLNFWQKLLRLFGLY